MMWKMPLDLKQRHHSERNFKAAMGERFNTANKVGHQDWSIWVPPKVNTPIIYLFLKIIHVCDNSLFHTTVKATAIKIQWLLQLQQHPESSDDTADASFFVRFRNKCTSTLFVWGKAKECILYIHTFTYKELGIHIQGEPKSIFKAPSFKKKRKKHVQKSFQK